MTSPYFLGNNSVPGGILPAGSMEAMTLPGRYLNQAISSFGSDIAEGLKKYDQNKQEMDLLRAEVGSTVEQLRNLPEQLHPYAAQYSDQIGSLVNKAATGGKSQLTSALLSAKAIQNNILQSYQLDVQKTQNDAAKFQLERARQQASEQDFAKNFAMSVDTNKYRYTPTTIGGEPTKEVIGKYSPGEIMSAANQGGYKGSPSALRRELEAAGKIDPEVSATQIPGTDTTAVGYNGQFAGMVKPQENNEGQKAFEKQKWQASILQSYVNGDASKNANDMAATHATLRRILDDAHHGNTGKTTKYDLAMAYVKATNPGFQRLPVDQQQAAMSSPQLAAELRGWIRDKAVGTISPEKAKEWAISGLKKINDWRAADAGISKAYRDGLISQGSTPEEAEKMAPSWDHLFKDEKQSSSGEASSKPLAPSQLSQFFSENPNATSVPVMVNGVIKTAYRKGFEPKQ